MKRNPHYIQAIINELVPNIPFVGKENTYAPDNLVIREAGGGEVMILKVIESVDDETFIGEIVKNTMEDREEYKVGHQDYFGKGFYRQFTTTP